MLKWAGGIIFPLPHPESSATRATFLRGVGDASQACTTPYCTPLLESTGPSSCSTSPSATLAAELTFPLPTPKCRPLYQRGFPGDWAARKHCQMPGADAYQLFLGLLLIIGGFQQGFLGFLGFLPLPGQLLCLLLSSLPFLLQLQRPARLLLQLCRKRPRRHPCCPQRSSPRGPS